jgi:hypothetical protein
MKAITFIISGMRQWLRWAKKSVRDVMGWLVSSNYVVVFGLAVIALAVCIFLIPCLERKLRFRAWPCSCSA